MREGIYKAKGERLQNELLGPIAESCTEDYISQRQPVTGSSPTPSPPSRTCGFPNIFCGSKVLGLFFLILFLIFLLTVV